MKPPFNKPSLILLQAVKDLTAQEQAFKIMRTRINRSTQVITDSTATILVLDNTKRKRRISASTVASMRDNTRCQAYIPECNDLFPTSKMFAMITKHAFMEEDHMKHFRKKQRQSSKQMKKARENSQALSLVA